MSDSFLFLEITDPDVNAFFGDLLLEINNVIPDEPVHLTIRGPYRDRISHTEIMDCREHLKHDVLRISGVGRFSNPGEEVVYFGVDSSNLRRVWWKPDYPITRFGFNPHLSVYRGSDRQLAAELAAFLESQDIELLCSEFEVVPVMGRQMNLLSADIRRSSTHSRFMDSNRLSPRFFADLVNLLDSHREEAVGSGRESRDAPHHHWNYEAFQLTSESRAAFYEDLGVSRRP